MCSKTLSVGKEWIKLHKVPDVGLSDGIKVKAQSTKTLLFFYAIESCFQSTSNATICENKAKTVFKASHASLNSKNT